MSIQDMYKKSFQVQNESFKRATGGGGGESIISGRVIGSGLESKSDNQFAQPRGVAYDSLSREIYVVDCNNHRVQVFDIRSLALLRQIGKGVQGKEEGCFNFAVGACIDGMQGNRIFVADTNNHRVSVYNRKNGAFVCNIGDLGHRPGLFNLPYGVAYCEKSKKIFIADYGNDRIQVFNAESYEFLYIIGKGKGVGPGELNQPIVSCVDIDTNRLFVADYTNNRIQVFDKDSGAYVHHFDGNNGNEGSALRGPRGLCVSDEFLFIADRENHRIQVYEKNIYVPLICIGAEQAGLQIGHFNRPMEIAVAENEGSLIVMDGFNHRIQILELSELRLRRMVNSLMNKSNSVSIKYSDSYKSKISLHALSISLFDCFVYIKKSCRLVISPYHYGLLYKLNVSMDDLTSLRLLKNFKSNTFLEFIDNYIERFPLKESLGLSISIDSKLEHKPSTYSIVKKQAEIFIVVLLETRKSSAPPSFFVPSILALHALLQLQWTPDVLKIEFLETLVFVLFNIDSESINVDDSQRISDCLIDLIKSMTWISLDSIQLTFSLISTYLNSKLDSKLSDRVSVIVIKLLSDIMSCISLDSKTIKVKNEGHITTTIYNDAVGLIFGDINSANIKSLFNAPASDLSNSYLIADSLKSNRDVLTILDSVVRLRVASLQDSCSESTIVDLQIQLLDKVQEYFSKSSKQLILNTAPKQLSECMRGGRRVWRFNEVFAVGDLIDCMDKANMWYESYITQVSDFDGSIKVHFMGWGQKWDDVVTKSQISTRISPLNSKSKNWRAELFNGGLIEIKCNEDVINQKWMWGRIVALDEVCECVDVSYSFENENPIIKRADLYGETICPIGMHTKDRSKAQAALIISPSIKIEENIRRTYEEGFGDDIFFLDKSDQVDPKNISNLRSLSQSTNPLENIAFITLEMIMAKILDILENYSVKLNKAKHLDIDSSPRIISNVDKLSFTAAKLALLTISISAYKRILSPLLCRPIITRCCLRLKLYASLALAGCTGGDATKLFQTFSDLAEISDDLSQSFGNSIEICLGKVIPQAISQFIKSKLIESTKKCYRSIVEDTLMQKDIYKIKLRDFLSSCYLDNLKNNRMTLEVIRIRNIIGRVSECPDSAFITYFQNEWFVALENWVSTFLSESIQVNSSEFDHEMKLLKDLVFMLNSAQFISGSIFNSMNLTTSFADAVFSTVFSKLDIKLFDELSKQTSLMFSFILDKRYSNEENVGHSSCGIILDDLLNFLNVIKNEKLISSLKVYYIPMTARRLLRGYSLSLHQEKLILDNLCIGAPLEGMIQEISDDSVKSVMKSYKQFLMKSSQSASGNLKVLSKLDARYLSYHLWAKYKPFSTISEVILPEQLFIMKEKFCEFQNSFGAKRITSFYLGLGTITLSCAIKRKKFDILLPEAHGILLLAFHHLKCLRTNYKAIGDMTGFSVSQIRTIVNELYNCIDGGILNSSEDESFSSSNQTEVSQNTTIISFTDSFLNGTSDVSSLDQPKLNLTTFTHDTSILTDWKSNKIDACIVRTLKISRKAMLLEDILCKVNELNVPSNTPFSIGEIRERCEVLKRQLFIESCSICNEFGVYSDYYSYFQNSTESKVAAMSSSLSRYTLQGISNREADSFGGVKELPIDILSGESKVFDDVAKVESASSTDTNLKQVLSRKGLDHSALCDMILTRRCSFLECKTFADPSAKTLNHRDLDDFWRCLWLNSVEGAATEYSAEINMDRVMSQANDILNSGTEQTCTRVFSIILSALPQDLVLEIERSFSEIFSLDVQSPINSTKSHEICTTFISRVDSDGAGTSKLFQLTKEAMSNFNFLKNKVGVEGKTNTVSSYDLSLVQWLMLLLGAHNTSRDGESRYIDSPLSNEPSGFHFFSSSSSSSSDKLQSNLHKSQPNLSDCKSGSLSLSVDPSCSDGVINGDVKMSAPSVDDSASSVTISDVIAKFITRVHSIILDLLSSRTISFSSVPISSERIKSIAQAILDCLVNTHINSKYSSSPQTFLDFLLVPYFPFASLSEINKLNSFTAKNTSELALKIRSSINDDNEVCDFLSFHILSQCEIISEIFPRLALETIVSKYTSLVASHNENDIISQLFEEEMSGLGGRYGSDVAYSYVANEKTHPCYICGSRNTQLFSLSCQHFCCQKCWESYLNTLSNGGKNCLSHPSLCIATSRPGESYRQCHCVVNAALLDAVGSTGSRAMNQKIVFKKCSLSLTFNKKEKFHLFSNMSEAAEWKERSVFSTLSEMLAPSHSHSHSSNTNTNTNAFCLSSAHSATAISCSSTSVTAVSSSSDVHYFSEYRQRIMKYMANCCNKLKQEILILLFHITDENVKSELGLYILGLGTIENAYVKLELVNLKFMTTAQHASSQIIKSWAEVLEYRAFGLFSSIKQHFLVKNFEQNQIHSRRLKDFCQIDDVFDRILLSLST